MCPRYSGTCAHLLDTVEQGREVADERTGGAHQQTLAEADGPESGRWARAITWVSVEAASENGVEGVCVTKKRLAGCTWQTADGGGGPLKPERMGCILTGRHAPHLHLDFTPVRPLPNLGIPTAR